MKAIVRAFSYVYHALLAVLLIVISGLALATSPESLHMEMLPWTGSTLAWTVFLACLFGLVTIGLALRGTLRPLFFLWALVVLVMMIRGFFFSQFRFEPGGNGAREALYLVVGALIALVGAWWQMMRTGERRY